MEIFSCLRAAIMAAADIKCKHEKVKAKFGVGPFQLKNDEVCCKQCKEQHDNDFNDEPFERRTNDHG